MARLWNFKKTPIFRNFSDYYLFCKVLLGGLYINTWEGIRVCLKLLGLKNLDWNISRLRRLGLKMLDRTRVQSNFIKGIFAFVSLCKLNHGIPRSGSRTIQDQNHQCNAMVRTDGLYKNELFREWSPPSSDWFLVKCTVGRFYYCSRKVYIL